MSKNDSMERDSAEESSAFSRLEDLLGGDASVAFVIAGFGFMLAWLWLGLAEGYPIFTDGILDSPSVLILLLAFSGWILCLGYADGCRHLLYSPKALAGGSTAATMGCVVLLVLHLGPLELDSSAILISTRICMVLVGTGAALLFERYGLCFSRLKPMTSIASYCLSTGVAFIAYSCIVNIDPPLSYAVFCFFPAAAAAMLARMRRGAKEEIPAPDKHVYAKGYTQLVIAFTVFFFAIGATRGMEPASDFAVASDTGFMGSFLVAMTMFWLLLQKRHKVGTFKILKTIYSVATIVLIMTVVLSPLSADDLFFSTAYYVDYLLVFMSFWLLLAFVGHVNETHPANVFALALGIGGIGMSAGWFAGIAIYAQYGHDRFFFSIAVGCAIAVFCTVGFSVKNFPNLTISGEAAKKLSGNGTDDDQANDPPRRSPEELNALIAGEYGLSKREQEVFALLARGFGADYIASKLAISYYTVRAHRRNIYAKLGIHSQEELLNLVIRFEEEQ